MKIAAKLLVATAVTSFSVGATLFATTGAAIAVPTRCTHGVESLGRWARAICHAGEGEFRAVAYCRYPADSRTTYGEWKRASPNRFSRAYCPGGVVTDSGLQTRN